jgi:hypothetical protein
VFGQRFLSHDCPPSVLAAAGRHFDVISVQPSIFSPLTQVQVETSIQELVNISKLAGRPVFVADQSTHFFENVTDASIGGVANQTVAGEFYTVFLDALRGEGQCWIRWLPPILF